VTLVRGSNWGEAEREREGARDSWRAVAAGRWRSRFPSCATASFLHPLRWMVKS
ncbi:Os05g0119350, partial [Oryza sativa Japonica Group]